MDLYSAVDYIFTCDGRLKNVKPFFVLHFSENKKNPISGVENLT